MLDPLPLLADVAKAFEQSSNLRTLVPRLGRALDRHISVVEVELAQRAGDVVTIVVYSPESERRWTGERSTRVLERMRRDLGVLVAASDAARVSQTEISGWLRVEAGEGVLGIGLSAEGVARLDAGVVRVLVDDLRSRLMPMRWLRRTADRSRVAYLRLVSTGIPVRGTLGHRTGMPVEMTLGHHTGMPVEMTLGHRTGMPVEMTLGHRTGMPVEMTLGQFTGMPVGAGPPPELLAQALEFGLEQLDPTSVPSFAEAQRRAIARALLATNGKIYGEDGAAALLGLKPSTLQSKMRKLGMDRLEYRG